MSGRSGARHRDRDAPRNGWQGRPCVDAPSGARIIFEQDWLDRQRSCVRPLCAALKMAAGRYGDARFGSRTKWRACWLFGRLWLAEPDLLQSFAHTVRRSPHIPDSRLRSLLLVSRQPSPVPGIPDHARSLPRWRAPFCWRVRSQPACAAFWPACGRAMFLAFPRRALAS